MKKKDSILFSFLVLAAIFALLYGLVLRMPNTDTTAPEPESPGHSIHENSFNQESAADSEFTGEMEADLPNYSDSEHNTDQENLPNPAESVDAYSESITEAVRKYLENTPADSYLLVRTKETVYSPKVPRGG